ncbi:MAG: DUF4261 domain-containing protein [Planctomycetota bacterium]
MQKGLFTQGMSVLLKEPLSTPELKRLLARFDFVETQSTDEEGSPEVLVFDYRPDLNAYLLVMPSSSPWPDDMGDPEGNTNDFVAWSVGQFGPLAHPGGLQRAIDQSWGWEDGGDVVQQHQAHVRLLIGYVNPSAPEDADDPEDWMPMIPTDYDAMGEMQFLTRAITAVLESPKALCYFNPGGEILRDEGGLRSGLNHAWNYELPPLDMWVNVRLFHVDQDWSVMDTVGNGQLDLPDLEAVFRSDKFRHEDVERFLRTASIYLLESDQDVEDGDNADGPGDLSWNALECEDSLSDPPRETIRWFPEDGSEFPEAFLDRGTAEEDPMVERDDLLDDDDDSEDWMIG